MNSDQTSGPNENAEPVAPPAAAPEFTPENLEPQLFNKQGRMGRKERKAFYRTVVVTKKAAATGVIERHRIRDPKTKQFVRADGTTSPPSEVSKRELAARRRRMDFAEKLRDTSGVIGLPPCVYDPNLPPPNGYEMVADRAYACFAAVEELFRRMVAFGPERHQQAVDLAKALLNASVEVQLRLYGKLRVQGLVVNEDPRREKRRIEGMSMQRKKIEAAARKKSDAELAKELGFEK